MENNGFNTMQYDYYSNTQSYIKMILDILPESMISIEKKQVIKELYNFYLNRFSEEKIKEILAISSMFREKIAVSNLNDNMKVYVGYFSAYDMNDIAEQKMEVSYIR